MQNCNLYLLKGDYKCLGVNFSMLSKSFLTQSIICINHISIEIAFALLIVKKSPKSIYDPQKDLLLHSLEARDTNILLKDIILQLKFSPI